MWKPALCSAAAALVILATTHTGSAQPLPEERLLAAQIKLGSGLIERLENPVEPGRNIIVSPGGVAAILALLDLGADDAMRKSMHAVLGFSGSSDAAIDFRALRATVGTVDTGIRDKDTSLALANAVVIDPTSQPITTTLDRMRATGAKIEVEDLTRQTTIDGIDAWVKERTKGVIPSILSGPLSSLGLVALNAMYFKSLWREPFSKQATRPQPFHLLDQTKVEVPMMYRTLRARYRESNRFAAIELEYKSDRFAMVVITSRDRPRPARDFAGAADWLDGAEFSDGIVELSLPRFKVDEKAELLKGLSAMGLSNRPSAFERLVQQPQEMVSISQKTFLAVDEEGTEAAAVTAVHSATRSSRPKVIVDKPFVFALRDRSSGLILLSGYIGRPTSGPTASLAR